MYNFNDQSHAEALDARIAELLGNLENLSGDTEDYQKTADNLVKLMQIKNASFKTEKDFSLEEERIRLQDEKLNIDRETLRLQEEKLTSDHDAHRLNEDKLNFEREQFAHSVTKERSWKPSPDAVVAAAGSVLGILAILHYEKASAITSKALSFVGKGLK